MTPENVYQLRLALGDGSRPLSQERLARLLGVAGHTVWRWENGHCLPSPLEQAGIWATILPRLPLADRQRFEAAFTPQEPRP